MFSLVDYRLQGPLETLKPNYLNSMEIQKPSFVTLRLGLSRFHRMTISFSLHVLLLLFEGDGIYDKLSNDEVISIVWDTLIRDEGKFKNIHEFCGKAV